ncbi:MAG: hypothetical protein FWG20_06370, partial [Candidatus Cloacimonetes bacterium]|nr:hypothetical protein [Candidatus Cloacimonadota bacterium]
MASLLGQFYTKIEGSQEDIASEGIAYILNKSINARDSINAFLHNMIGINFKNISYITQNIGENKERPDISGIDENGLEQIIIEAKFWASLTDNQPVEYLKRLNNDSVLLFVCPTLRKVSIGTEIESRLNDADIEFEKNELYIKT